MTWISDYGAQKAYVNWDRKGSYPFTVLFYSVLF